MNKLRKPYCVPAILAEDQLEQTSLACNVTVDPNSPDAPPNAFSPDFECGDNIAKGPAFAMEPYCTETDFKDPIALS